MLVTLTLVTSTVKANNICINKLSLIKKLLPPFKDYIYTKRESEACNITRKLGCCDSTFDHCVSLQGIEDTWQHSKVWVDIPFQFYWKGWFKKQGQNLEVPCQQVFHCVTDRLLFW